MIVLSFGKSGNINVKLVLQHCCVLQPLFKPVNNQICCKSGLLWLVKRATYLLDSFCSNVARQVAGFCCPFRGGSRIFFRRGCTLLLLYFSTNEPHSFFFCRIPVVLENRRSSWGEGGAHPCTLPLDPPQPFNRTFTVA